MASVHQPARHAHDHDDPAQWQQTEFVEQWVTRDDGRQDERRPMLQALLAAITYARDEAIRVLDVGAGYGLLSKDVLAAFPNATVTLQDVSAPMFVHAKERLAAHAGRTRYVNSDFSRRDWASGLGGPFDVVVSGIAIHNMYDDNLIASIYADICALTKPGGIFLNLDYAQQSGGVDAHVQWLKDGGFSKVAVEPQSEKVVLLTAVR